MVDSLVHKNDRYYTNEMYSRAEEENKRREEELMKEMEQKKKNDKFRILNKISLES